jgi:hypothetical protein
MCECVNVPDSFVGFDPEPTTKANKKKQVRRESAMSRSGLSYLPRQNPCAQCGKPIAIPEWVESSEGRTTYLWHCWVCDYRFEATAFFDDVERQPLAA